MKIFLWIAASFFLILFGFLAGIFLAPLLAYLTGFPVFVIPVVIAGLSLIAFIVLHFAYKKAQRATQNTSFYYPGLLIPIFLCSGLLTIYSDIKFGLHTYDSHGIIYYYGPYGIRIYYNSLGVKLFENNDIDFFYAYNEYGDVFICCYRYCRDTDDQYKIDVQYKIYTLDGTLVKSGDRIFYYYEGYYDFRFKRDMENDIAKKSIGLIPE